MPRIVSYSACSPRSAVWPKCRLSRDLCARWWRPSCQAKRLHREECKVVVHLIGHARGWCLEDDLPSRTATSDAVHSLLARFEPKRAKPFLVDRPYLREQLFARNCHGLSSNAVGSFISPSTIKSHYLSLLLPRLPNVIRHFSVKRFHQPIGFRKSSILPGFGRRGLTAKNRSSTNTI